MIPKLGNDFCTQILSVQNLLSEFLGIKLSLILHLSKIYLPKQTIIFDIRLSEKECLLLLLNVH